MVCYAELVPSYLLTIRRALVPTSLVLSHAASATHRVYGARSNPVRTEWVADGHQSGVPLLPPRLGRHPVDLWWGWNCFKLQPVPNVATTTAWVTSDRIGLGRVKSVSCEWVNCTVNSLSRTLVYHKPMLQDGVWGASGDIYTEIPPPAATARARNASWAGGRTNTGIKNYR